MSFLFSGELINYTSATTVDFDLDPEGYYLDISTKDSMTLHLVSTAGAMYGAMKDTINIRTNADSYKLYLSMSSEQLDSSSNYTNNLYLNNDNTETTNKLAPTSGTATTPATISTNSWGYAIPGYSNFSSASAYSEDTTELSPDALWANIPVYGNADIIAVGDEQPSSAGDNVDIYYGVKANTSIAAGRYRGKVAYSAVTDSSITLSELGSVSPSVLSQISGGETVQITLALNATLEQVGNNIIVNIGSGTCTSPTASLNQAGNVVITCTSPANLPGTYDVTVNLVSYGRTYFLGGAISYIYSGTAALDDMIAALGDQMNTITSTNRDFYNLTTMQGMTSEICNSVATPKANIVKTTSSLAEYNIYTELLGEGYIVPEIHLTDTRDSQNYTVRKLADGNCWMTDNLRLGKAGAVTLTPSDSNVRSNFSLPAPSAIGTKWDSQATTAYVIWRDGNTGDNVPQEYTSPSALYNWYAATAGAKSSNNTNLMTASEGQAADSICPKNWQLPTNGGATTDKSYGKLVNTYAGIGENSGATAGTAEGNANATRITTLLEKPLSFVYSDDYSYSNGTLFSRPVGLYWSSTVSSATSAHNLLYSMGGTYRDLYPQDDDDKGYAFAVRCVAQ